MRRANEINLVAINKHPVLNLTYVVDLTFVSRAPVEAYEGAKFKEIKKANVRHKFAYLKQPPKQ